MQRSDKFSINHDDSNESTPLMFGSKNRSSYSAADAARPSEELERLMEEGRANHLTSKIDDSYPDDNVDNNKEEKKLSINSPKTTNSTYNTKKTKPVNPLKLFKPVKHHYSKIQEAIQLLEEELQKNQSENTITAYYPRATSVPGIIINTLCLLSTIVSTYYCVKLSVSLGKLTYTISAKNMSDYNSHITPFNNQTCGQEWAVSTGTELCGNNTIFKQLLNCSSNAFYQECKTFAHKICMLESHYPPMSTKDYILTLLLTLTSVGSLFFLFMNLINKNKTECMTRPYHCTYEDLSSATKAAIDPALTAYDIPVTQKTATREIIRKLRKIYDRESNNFSELESFKTSLFNDLSTYFYYLKEGGQVTSPLERLPAGAEIMNMIMSYVDGCNVTTVSTVKPNFFPEMKRNAADTLAFDNNVISQAFNTR